MMNNTTYMNVRVGQGNYLFLPQNRSGVFQIGKPRIWKLGPGKIFPELRPVYRQITSSFASWSPVVESTTVNVVWRPWKSGDIENLWLMDWNNAPTTTGAKFHLAENLLGVIDALIREDNRKTSESYAAVTKWIHELSGGEGVEWID